MSLKLFLTKEKFLKHFTEKDELNNIIRLIKSEDDFEKTLQIAYNQTMTLYDINRFVPRDNGKTIYSGQQDARYLKREEILGALYDILIVNREKYLTRFYSSYFPIVNPLELNWKYVELDISEKYNSQIGEKQTPEKYISVQLNDNSRKMIRNMFYLELLDKTKIINTVKSHESFWYALTNAFNRLKLQDRFFAKSSLELMMRKTPNGDYTQTFFYLFQGYLPKASILNPYSIKWIIENRLYPLLPRELRENPNKTIFSPVMSWCSYLIAFMHLDDTWKNYVGIDVIRDVCRKAIMLRKYYGKLNPLIFGEQQKRVKIICKPSEDVHSEGVLEKKMGEKVELVIACFPYFNMEEYSGELQSTKQYPDYSDWLKKYVEPTIDMCINILKPGGIFAYITNNYSTLGTRKTRMYYDLKTDFMNICLSKLELEYRDKYILVNRTSPLRMAKKERMETMFVYSKKI
jgi:hypothetical protein